MFMPVSRGKFSSEMEYSGLKISIDFSPNFIPRGLNNSTKTEVFLILKNSMDIDFCPVVKDGNILMSRSFTILLPAPKVLVLNLITPVEELQNEKLFSAVTV